MPIHKPRWFSDDHIMISTAATCGLTKGGRPLHRVDPTTAERVRIVDADTGELIDAIDDQLLDDMQKLTRVNAVTRAAKLTNTLHFVHANEVDLSCAVPIYYDRRYDDQFSDELANNPEFAGFSHASLGELLASDILEITNGHGSPSQEQRIGEIPYIKVSDLRAGLVNINPTNRVPLSVAKKFWRGEASQLRPYDLLCPERTSKNIGDFCVLMPGQEDVLLTKEIIVLRPGKNANFDAFYLLWAMTLTIVRNQWKRIVFMQTNREDVGKRYLEIRIPTPTKHELGHQVSEPFRQYYSTIASARTKFQRYLSGNSAHHFFMSGGELGSMIDD
jgi:type I restriction enzyme M protein